MSNCQISHGQVALPKRLPPCNVSPSKDKVDLTLGKRSSQVKGFKGSKGTPCMAGLEIGDEITHVNDLRFMNWHPGLVRTGGLGQWVQGWSAPSVVGGSEKVVLPVDDFSFSSGARRYQIQRQIPEMQVRPRAGARTCGFPQ